MITLYFSKFCKHCADLIDMLRKENMLIIIDTFTCVDNENNDGIDKNLPNFVSVVPYLTIDEEPFKLSGEMIFKWIDFKKEQLKKIEEHALKM